MKKQKLKKTLVDQILDKAGIAHDALALNALKDELPDDITKADIYKTLALTNGIDPIIGIVPLTRHLSEKKISQSLWYEKSQYDSAKRLAENNWLHPWCQ